MAPQVLYNKRVELPKDILMHGPVHQHGRREVRWKPSIQTFKGNNFILSQKLIERDEVERDSLVYMLPPAPPEPKLDGIWRLVRIDERDKKTNQLSTTMTWVVSEVSGFRFKRARACYVCSSLCL